MATVLLSSYRIPFNLKNIYVKCLTVSFNTNNLLRAGSHVVIGALFKKKYVPEEKEPKAISLCKIVNVSQGNGGTHPSSQHLFGRQRQVSSVNSWPA